MTHIRLNLPTELNQSLKIFKQIKGFTSMEEVIITILFSKLSKDKLTKEILKQSQVNVNLIKNKEIKPLHDYFNLGGNSFDYHTQLEFGRIDKREIDFLNKATKEEIERRYK